MFQVKLTEANISAALIILIDILSSIKSMPLDAIGIIPVACAIHHHVGGQ